MNAVAGVGALVDVRGPLVERHRTDLEQQADEQQTGAGDQQAVPTGGLAAMLPRSR